MSEDARHAIVTVSTETAEKSGFRREDVWSYFHKNPPLEVCLSCAKKFEVWDLARLRLVGALKRK